MMEMCTMEDNMNFNIVAVIIGGIVCLLSVVGIIEIVIEFKKGKRFAQPKMSDGELSRYIYWCIKHENDD